MAPAMRVLAFRDERPLPPPHSRRSRPYRTPRLDVQAATSSVPVWSSGDLSGVSRQQLAVSPRQRAATAATSAQYARLRAHSAVLQPGRPHAACPLLLLPRFSRHSLSLSLWRADPFTKNHAHAASAFCRIAVRWKESGECFTGDDRVFNASIADPSERRGRVAREMRRSQCFVQRVTSAFFLATHRAAWIHLASIGVSE